ncbi:MAG: hypothetical protein J0H85_05035 [Sediminibacterium magnilacihabitans]|jgi:serine/threonine protein phosphatase PrpC|nr:hypothetical protein [Sediminibacterium magnilacihabitans]PQV61729.1 hypothetical protein CLV53_1012 [Sediminibacterium magnilacihabitans]
MNITILQIQKRSSYLYQNIQDKFAFNKSTKTFALADGTTQSYNSEEWAELITKKFVSNPTFEHEKLVTNFIDCAQIFKQSNIITNTNPAKASLEKSKQKKGATATFIGLQFFDNNHLKIISCGDSNLFMFRNNRITCFPFRDLDSLDANNHFINTEQILEDKTNIPSFQYKEIPAEKNTIYILATDALSRLILKKPSIIEGLMQLNNFQKLYAFCMKYWSSRELEEDDITSIIIDHKNNGTIKKIIPDESFSFPKEEEKEFVPTNLGQENNHYQFTDMHIQEIIRRFDHISNDLSQIKRKQRLLEALLMIVVSLSVILSIAFFRFQINYQSDKSKNELRSDIRNKFIIEDSIAKTTLLEIRKLNEKLNIRDSSTLKIETNVNEK